MINKLRNLSDGLVVTVSLVSAPIAAVAIIILLNLQKMHGH